MKYQVIVWRYYLGTIRLHVCLQIDASSPCQKNYKRIAIHREINQKNMKCLDMLDAVLGQSPACQTTS